MWQGPTSAPAPLQAPPGANLDPNPNPHQLFYAVDTGLSIGFGAVAEEKLTSKLFTIFHVLLGASACGGAIALFAESAVDGSNQIAATEYSQATLRAAFARADGDNSGVLSHKEFSAVFAQCGLTLTPAELAQAPGGVFKGSLRRMPLAWTVGTNSSHAISGP